MGAAETGENGTKQLLKGWKGIAGFFGCDERTVRRWAADMTFPVHRVPGRQRAAVYAYSTELDAWLRARQGALVEAVSPAEEPAEAVAPALSGMAFPAVARLRSRHLVWGAAGAIAVVLLGGAFWAWSSGSSPVQATRASTVAEDRYLEGMYQWEKRTPQSLQRATELFQQAIAASPDYAPAYAGLANTYNLLREYGTMPSQEAYAASAKAARRAVEIDPRNADAQSALAFAEFYGLRRMNEGLERFRLARDLDPGSAKIRQWLANALLHVGRFDEALIEINEAQRLAPASSSVLASKGLALYCAGQVQAAITLLTEVARSEPTLRSPHAYLAFIHLGRGDYPAFLSEMRIAAELKGESAPIAVAEAGQRGFASGGFAGMIRLMLEEETRQLAAGRGLNYNVARLHAMAGDEYEAVRYLRAAIAANEEHVMMVLVDPAFRQIDNSARFQAVIKDIGLTAR